MLRAEACGDRLSILIVDDDHHLLESLSEMLRLRLPMLSIETRTSAAPALETLRTGEFHLVISDIRMPGMDGFKFLSEIKKIQPWTPVILITGHGDNTTSREALQCGAYDLVHKPLDRDQFVLAVQRAVEAYNHRMSTSGHQVKQAMLCIFGLHPGMTVEELRDLLKPYGTVVWARLVVNSNAKTVALGYAEMSSEDESAAAIKGLDGHRVETSTIRVGLSNRTLASWTV